MIRFNVTAGYDSGWEFLSFSIPPEYTPGDKAAYSRWRRKQRRIDHELTQEAEVEQFPFVFLEKDEVISKRYKCEWCGGSKKHTRVVTVGDFTDHFEEQCPYCQGKGYILKEVKCKSTKLI